MGFLSRFCVPTKEPQLVVMLNALPLTVGLGTILTSFFAVNGFSKKVFLLGLLQFCLCFIFGPVQIAIIAALEAPFTFGVSFV